jgi:anaerobic selenocysteine-containing dehydrogenase
MVTNVRKNGGKLVVIDPVRQEIGEKANIYVRIRPGTDGAFALGLAHHILATGLEDIEFVAEHVVGVEALRALASEWTPDRVSEVTGCQPRDVVEVAELFAKEGPSGIYDGLGIEHHGAGVDTVRLASSLVALCGYADAQVFHDKDGASEVLPAFLPVAQQEPIPPAPQKRPVGFEEYELFCTVHRQAQASLLPRAILEEKPYAVRSLVVFGANPAVTTPDSNVVKKAYDKLDLLVVVDPFLSETGELADFVLPAASFAEDEPLRFGAGAEKNRAVAEPRGQSRPDSEILFDLARRVGLESFFPWKTIHEAFAGETKPVWDDWVAAKAKAATDGGARRFPTVSGKIEIESALLPRFGLKGAPTLLLPEATTDEMPLRLVTGPRQRAFINSQFHKVPSVARLVPDAVAELHPTTAKDAGIDEGQSIAVVTPRGRAVFLARVTPTVVPGVVVVPNGWDGESNGNQLTSLEGLDPISGFPRLRSLACRIEKA